MLHATLKSLLAQKLRLVMSAFAIVLGVAFVSGSFVFTDTLNSSFTDIFRQTAPDVTVRPAHAEAEGLPTRVYVHRGVNTEFRPTPHANRV